VAPNGPRLIYLSWTQSPLNGWLSLRAGRLTINSVYGEEFAQSQYFKAFSSVAFDFVSIGVFLNAPGGFGYPLTTWGARVKVEPKPSFYAMAGVYNGDPPSKQADRHGLDLGLDGPPFVIAEAGYRRNYGHDATGLPVNLKLGAYSNGGSTHRFNSSTTGGGRYGVYAIADQALVRWGHREEKRHLGIFGSLVAAPDQSVNPLPYFWDAGVVAYGPFLCRPKDFVALGAAYGFYSADLRSEQEMPQASDSTAVVQTNETTLELSYGIHARPGLLIQPALQYIVNPGGIATVPNALAIGTNLVMSF
jgi:porin